MISLIEMKEKIVDELYVYKAYELPNVCTGLGMKNGDSSEAFSSKRVYVRNRISGYSKEKIMNLLYKLKDEFEINLIPEELFDYNITNITKKSIKELLLKGYKNGSDFFSPESHYKINWHGTMNPIEFIKRITNIDNIKIEDTRFDTLEEELWQHTVNNDDYDIDWFFEFDRLPYKQLQNIEFLKIIAVKFIF